jgi:hypothetical protein
VRHVTKPVRGTAIADQYEFLADRLYSKTLFIPAKLLGDTDEPFLQEDENYRAARSQSVPNEVS